MGTVEEENTAAITTELERLLSERPFGVNTAIIAVANVAANIRMKSGQGVCELLHRASSELGFDADEEAAIDDIIHRFEA